MKKTILIVLISLVLTPGILLAQDNLKKIASDYFDRGEEEKALELYKQVLDENKNDIEVLWKTAMLHTRVGARLAEDDDRDAYFAKAYRLINRALEMESGHADVYFTKAVILGRKSEYASTQDALAKAEKIRNFGQKALETDPNHQGAMHVLGLWHQRIANLSFAERSIIYTIYGGVPEDASNDQAEAYLKKAAELAPDMILYQFDLARFYSETGQPEKARQILQEIPDMEPRFKDDPTYKKNAAELLASL